MSSTFAKVVDSFRTATTGYNAGSGTLALLPGSGAVLGMLPSNRIFRITAVNDPDTYYEEILTVLEATGITADDLMGVTPSAGYSDMDLDPDTTIDIRVCARDISEIQDALNAAEAAIETLQIEGIPGATGPPGPQGIPGNTGPAGLQGVPGPVGADGPQGPPGTANARYTEQWNYSTTSSGDPGTGNVSINTGAWTSANLMLLSKTTGDGYALPGGEVKVGDEIFIQEKADANAFAHYNVISVTDSVTYMTYGITLIDNGTDTPPKKKTAMAVSVLTEGVPSSFWYNGSGAPSPANGRDGDYYLDDLTGNVYAMSGGTWSLVSNIEGPVGATGPTGPQGIQGHIGLTGATGATGAAGPQGIQGPIGVTGGSGPAGATGPQGVKGDPGIAGAAGAAGAAGPQGLKGDPGIAGATGPAGAQGVKGDSGPIGLTGATGGAGPAGPQGSQGLKGDPGATGASGPGGPQGIQGVPGPVGSTGPAGSQGLKGDPGATGASGPGGPQGIQGVPGPVGSTGPAGSQGLKGDTGLAGPQGPAGSGIPAGVNHDLQWNNSGAFAGGGPTWDGSVLALSTSSWNISCPGTQTGSQQFGLLSSATGLDSLAVGQQATATASYAMAIGPFSTSSTFGGIVFGAWAVSTMAAQVVFGSIASPIDCMTFTGGMRGLTDAQPPNDTIYFSSTSSKLAFKDSTGVSHVLYGAVAGATFDLQWNNAGSFAGGGPTWNGASFDVPGASRGQAFQTFGPTAGYYITNRQTNGSPFLICSLSGDFEIYNSGVGDALIISQSNNQATFAGNVFAPSFTGDGSGLTGISESQITNLVSDLDLKAPLDSPAFTGIPTALTAPPGTSTKQLATTEFVTTNAGAGPQGPQGPQGIPGATGPQGSQGNTGATGAAGPAGADSTVPGPTGPQGIQGPVGATGPIGATGLTGPQGIPGSGIPAGSSHDLQWNNAGAFAGGGPTWDGTSLVSPGQLLANGAVVAIGDGLYANESLSSGNSFRLAYYESGGILLQGSTDHFATTAINYWQVTTASSDVAFWGSVSANNGIFGGYVTSATFLTTGSNASYVITRRDTLASQWQLLSQGGEFALYNIVTATDAISIDPTTNVMTVPKVNALGGSTDYGFQSGTMGMQGYDTNNCWLADNVYFDGSAFRYKDNGYGVMAYFIGGTFQIRTAPQNYGGQDIGISSFVTVFSISQIGDVTASGTISAARGILGPIVSGINAALVVLGVTDTTSYISAELYGQVSGYGTFIKFSDGFTYNYCIGTNGTGDLEFWPGRYQGNAGTLAATFTQAGAANFNGNIGLAGYNWFITAGGGDNIWGLGVWSSGTAYATRVTYYAETGDDHRAGFYDAGGSEWVAYADDSRNFQVVNQLSVNSGGMDYSIKMGTMGLQSFATNNCWIADNVYFDGSAFRYKDNGYGVLAYFYGGGFAIHTYGQNVGGGGATVFNDLAALTVSNGGDLTVAGNAYASNFATSGSNAGYVITRRDNNAAAFQIFSGSGDFQVYSYTAGVTVFDIAGSTSLATFSNDVTINGKLIITGTSSGGPNIQLNGYNWYICPTGDNSWGFSVYNSGTSYWTRVNYWAGTGNDTRAGFYDAGGSQWVAYADDSRNFNVANKLTVNTGLTTVNGGLTLPTFADSAAPTNSLYLGSDHKDSHLSPNLCKKDSSGNVNIMYGLTGGISQSVVYVDTTGNFNTSPLMQYDSLGGVLSVYAIQATNRIQVNGGSTDYSIRMGTMGLQAYATNNCWLSDNMFYDGSNWNYRGAGYGTMAVFLNGGFQIRNSTISNSLSGQASIVNLSTLLSVTASGALATGSGPSSARPTGITIGCQWYDTTLKKPIWWDANSGVWRDAMGNSV